MAPIVVPNVTRFSVHQTLGGQPVVNIVDMQVDTTGSVVSREEGIREVAQDILNNWNDHMLTIQADDIVAQEVSWVDLNSLNGPVGSVSSSSTNTWPQAGFQATGSVMPAVVALRVDKATAGGRGTKRGRMYLAGMRETQTDEGVSQTWNAAAIAGYNLELAGFLDGVNDQNGVTEDVQRQMVVVHNVGGATSWTAVTGLTANPSVSTQVRRGVLR